MPNESGRAYGLTTLCPIKLGTEGNSSYASLTRQYLHDQQAHACDESSPMAQVPNTYLCRFFVLDDVRYQGKPAELDRLKSPYLVFVAEIHGDLTSYLRGLWGDAEAFVKKVWKHCVGFQNVNTAELFVDYIKKCQVQTTFYFNGSTDDPLAEQLKSLYLMQEFSRFAYASAIKKSEELKQDFEAFIKRTQPSNIEGPTWRAGASTLKGAISEASKEGGSTMIEDPGLSLDLYDIQGNIVKAYGHDDYVAARHMVYQVHDGEKGRGFVRALLPHVTNSAPWSRNKNIRDDNQKPTVTLNIAFTFAGLQALELPEASLRTFPEEFMSGMAKRWEILGDDGKSAPDQWDPVWRKPIHILISLNGPRDVEGQSPHLADKYKEVAKIVEKFHPGVECLSGHRGLGREDRLYQAASVLYDHNNQPTPKEHFGYHDGISNPFFKGTDAHPNNVIGGGKVTGKDPQTKEGWEPLETGEFILGYKDEAFEYPVAPMPPLLGRNGTYMVFRKLHQNVGAFEKYMKEMAVSLGVEKEFLKAKFVGRWPNGAPLATFPTKESADKLAVDWSRAEENRRSASSPEEKTLVEKEYGEIKNKLVAFDYDHDIAGGHCPVGAHIRRANPRGSLEYGRTKAFNTHGALSDRRRVLRRGLPYGDSTDRTDDKGEHGSIIMMICANIRRQFEFVQQQWMNYGNDFKLGNDKDPITGNQCQDGNDGDGRMIIMSEPGSGKRPLLCGGIPRFVETRGGEYFFIPSLTALRMIGEGIIDPT